MGLIKPRLKTTFNGQLGSNDQIDDKELLLIADPDGRTDIYMQGKFSSLVDNGHIKGMHRIRTFHPFQEAEPSHKIGGNIPCLPMHHMVDVGEMASQHLWRANFPLLTEFSEYLPFIYKALPDPLLSPLSRVKMRIGKSSRLSTPVHEEGVFLHLEEERRVRRLIPEKGELGLGH